MNKSDYICAKFLSARWFMTVVASIAFAAVTFTFCYLLAKHWNQLDPQTIIAIFAFISNIITMIAISYFQRTDRNGNEDSNGNGNGNGDPIPPPVVK